MKIKILSRQKVEQIAATINESTLIISINCPGDTHVEFCENPCIKKILYLEFFDAENTDNYYKSMDDAQARQVVQVVKEYADKVSQIIVHCDAGQSRSAGVAAAISLYLNGSDNWVFNSPMYCPNRTCYRRTLNAFYN